MMLMLSRSEHFLYKSAAIYTNFKSQNISAAEVKILIHYIINTTQSKTYKNIETKHIINFIFNHFILDKGSKKSRIYYIVQILLVID